MIGFPTLILRPHSSFSQFVKSWTSMEHDSNWEPKVFGFQVSRSQIIISMKVKNTLKMLPWGDKVTHYLVQVDKPSQSFEGTEEEYR